MAVKFYLGDKQHEIHCNTNSTFTELAGAFNIGTLELEWNECKHSIFPHTKLYIEETETNSTWFFDISNDNVEVAKKNGTVKYIHKLTVTQLTHSVSNVPLRNSRFTQPYNSNFKYKRATFFAAKCNYLDENAESVDPYLIFDHNYNTNQYGIDNYSFNIGNLKIKKGYLKITTIYSICESVNYEQIARSIKGANININGVVILLVNADNTSDYKTVIVGNNINTDVALSDDVLSWLRNKKVFLKVNEAQINTSLWALLPIEWGTTGNYVYPNIAGLINAELTLETYKYALSDVIYTLLKQASKDYNGRHLEYQDYILDTNVNGTDLTSIVAPEFDFTGLDLYEAIAKVYSFIDAFPVMYEDSNGYKHISCEFLNDLSEETIEDVKVADVKTSLSEENFTNKLASYYQNGKKEEPITFPAKQQYRFPATSKYGIADANDWYWFVSKPIDYIEKICTTKLGTYNNTVRFEITFNGDYFGPVGFSYRYIWWFQICVNEFGNFAQPIEIDLTESVFSSDVYKQLPNGYAYGKTIIENQTKYTQNQNNTLYYERGGNSIYLGITGKINKTGTNDVLDYVLRWSLLNMVGIRGVDLSFSGIDYFGYSGTKSNYVFNITYYPILDGKVSQESTSNKSERETIVAQGNSGTQLNRLGNNLQGLIAKLGNEEKAITLPITKFKDKIKLGTKFIDDLGNTWIANKIQTTFTTDKEKVIVNATFTRNYNALAQFTTLNQEKRFYDISEKITSKGYENINEFIYFTNDWTIDFQNLADYVAIHHIGLNAILERTFNDAYTAVISGLNPNDFDTELQNSVLITYGKQEIWTYMPITVYGCGNQICFEMGFDSPLAAGSRIESYNPDGDQTEYAIKEWLYTDDEGTSDLVDIRCHYFSKYVSPELWRYPQFDYADSTMVEMLKIKNLHYYKKPNEIFHLNYALNFMPYWSKTFDELNTPQYKYEEIFFGDTFINKNAIIPNNNAVRQFVLYVSNEPYSIIDNVAHGTQVSGTTTIDVNSWVVDYVDNVGTKIAGTIDVKVNGTIYDVSAYKSWCIADIYGNVYIAVNKGENSFSGASLRFFTSRNRKM